MSGVNKVILIGNLGKDPEVRNTQAGAPVVSFTLATSESWKDKDSGERKERTEWHRIVVFNERLGEVAEKYLKKGSRVYLEGSLQTYKWTDQSGQEKYTTEVVLARFRGEITLLGDPNGGIGEGERDRGVRETSRPAQRREPEMAGAGRRGGTPSWEPDRGGDFGENDIPF